ncbi:MAG: hypothetical protein QXX41_00055 [Nitrososphaerota archaeon]
MAAQIPTVTPLGILPRFRAKVFRIRAAIPEPIYASQAERVDVQIGGASLTREYVGTTTVAGQYAELWVFKKDSDVKAIMTVHKDPTTGEYVFNLSRLSWDAMDVLFDAAIIGTSPTFPAVTADMTPSVGYVSFRGAPPA